MEEWRAENDGNEEKASLLFSCASCISRCPVIPRAHVREYNSRGKRIDGEIGLNPKFLS